jgi:hypothetical protein
MQPVSLVLIEDIASEAEIAVRLLEAGGFSCNWKRVDSEAALRRELALSTLSGPSSRRIDILEADHGLATGRFATFALLAEVRLQSARGSRPAPSTWS